MKQNNSSAFLHLHALNIDSPVCLQMSFSQRACAVVFMSTETLSSSCSPAGGCISYCIHITQGAFFVCLEENFALA